MLAKTLRKVPGYSRVMRDVCDLYRGIDNCQKIHPERARKPSVDMLGVVRNERLAPQCC